MANAKVGIACYGAGFATYRYLEVPYYQSLLVAQPLPLLFPHNFRHGKEALFFNSPEELLDTVNWALEHPVESEAIAKAAHLKLMQHHLTIHRAQWMAQIVEARVKEFEASKLLEFPW